jgi:hypothetical protein
MTTSQKIKYKTKGYGKQWDSTTSITAYFTGLDKFQTSLADCGITTSIKEMTMAVSTRMWESKMFTKDQMVAWENKTATQQTWQNLQDYFTEKWLEQRQYLQATMKHYSSRMQPLLLETCLRDTYVMYPYHKSHKNRALGSPECYQIRYLITQRIRNNNNNSKNYTV